MQTKIQYGGAGRDYKLSSAILLYTCPNSTNSQVEHVAASVHEVEHVGRGQPLIKPGVPVSVAALERLMLSLGKSSGTEFLAPNILSLGLDRMAWWCPAGRRRIWFKTYDEKHQALRAVNGKFVHHPPLLFVVKNGLNVWAMLEDKRPTPTTKLYRAPYWNLSTGHMCNGNLKLPACQPGNIAGFESAFFNSNFSHGGNEGLTFHRGGHAGLWTELAQRKTKPDAAYWRRVLIGAGTNVKQALQ